MLLTCSRITMDRFHPRRSSPGFPPATGKIFPPGNSRIPRRERSQQWPMEWASRNCRPTRTRPRRETTTTPSSVRYKETFSDGSIPEPERDEARHRYDQLLAFLKRHYRPERDPGGAVTRLVHRSIQRLCTSLRKPVAGQSVPDPVALAFAEYIEQHILVPSRRYTRAKPGSNVRLARGELAGRLIFECPPGHRWSARA